MYLAVDVGATKTLLAVFTKDGNVLHEQKIATDHKYDQFLADLKSALGQDAFRKYKIETVCCALPGRIDRVRGIGIRFGNIGWRATPIVNDLKKALQIDEVFIENDANLAALFEAQSHKKYKKVLYITLSTGIGIGIIINGKLDPAYEDAEAGHMVLEHEGKLKKWEEFASGKALVERYGKKAAELDNHFAWKSYAKDVARGLDILLATLQPEVVIVGGSVGAHLEKFSDLLKDELKKIRSHMVPVPPIIKADKPEEAVVYGCYEYIRQNLN